MSRNYYIVLGISRGADLEKIKRAYRTIAKSSHPDISQSEETAQRFREACQAYEVLSDSEKRRQYDEELAREGSRVRVERVPEIVLRQRSAFSESMNANFLQRRRKLQRRPVFIRVPVNPSAAPRFFFVLRL